MKDPSSGNADVPVDSACSSSEKKNADEDVGAPREWYSRGYLPHRDHVGLSQAIIFRLADSLPQQKLRELEGELAALAEDCRDVERRRKIEDWLDSGMGCCALRHPEVARQVQDSILHFDGDRYRVIAWCIMPNHVHVLIEPRRSLARNEALGLGIPDREHLWMREYWDRYIRNQVHLNNVIDYIHQNPVNAGLCDRAQDWPWSSAGNADVRVGSGRKKNGRRKKGVKLILFASHRSLR